MMGHSESKISTAESLNVTVREQFKECLNQILPIWQVEEKLDYRRKHVPNAIGGFEIVIEKYFGFQTWIQFERRVKSDPKVISLRQVIMENQPELLGYVACPNSSLFIGSETKLLSCFLTKIQKDLEKNIDLATAIDHVLLELDEVLFTGYVNQQISTALGGLKLSGGIDSIELGDGIYIRRLSDEQISTLSSHDVYLDARSQFTSHFVTTAITIQKKVPVKVTMHSAPEIMSADFIQGISDSIEKVLCALHIFKKGKVTGVMSYSTPEPILPGIAWPNFTPHFVNPFQNMELNSGEVESFLKIYQAFAKNERPELAIAANRLLISETRISPVDSLIDAITGLEVLLNPNDFGELAFRVALNYAFLAGPSEQRLRYEHIKEVQKTRNRIIHGGLNLRSKDAQLISDHSKLAIDCLRDTIKRFLTDPSLSTNEKLSAEFWIDRIIPPL